VTPGPPSGPTTPAARWAWRAATLAVLAGMITALVLGPYRSLVVGSVVGSVAGSHAADRGAPCLPGQPVPIMDSPHIAQARAASVHYSSDPPTSGPHFAFVAAPGSYSSPVPDGLTVHALEHGHVAVQYDPHTPAPTVAALRDIARRYPADVLLAPRPGLTGIVLTAWGRIDRLQSLDEHRIETFIDQLRGRYDHGWAGTDPC
jgi:uncharacterized protein DUF3105